MVWPRALRVGHGLLALAVAGAWLTRASLGDAHLWFGYFALLLVLLRVAWGFSSRHPFVRFSGFIHAPAVVRAYAGAFWRGTAGRRLGHNPLGGYMILALLGILLLLGLSGGLYTTDWLWGYGWLAELHAGLGRGLLGLVLLHVLGGVWASFKYRENLVAAMFNGKKRALSED